MTASLCRALLALNRLRKIGRALPGGAEEPLRAPEGLHDLMR
jgi:hypothetical protein